MDAHAKITPAEALEKIEHVLRSHSPHIVYRSVDGKAPLVVHGMDVQEFTSLLGVLRPPVLYIHKDHFEAKIDVPLSMATALGLPGGGLDDFLDGDTEDADESADEARVKQFVRSELAKLVKKWGKHDGELAEMSSYIVYESVLHTVTVEANWLADLYDELDDVAARKTEMEEQDHAGYLERTSSEKATQARLVNEMAGALVKDPRYTAPKSSKQKRAFLAETLYPDAEPYIRLMAVERADNMVWAAQG